MPHQTQRVIWSDKAHDAFRTFNPDEETFAAFAAREFPGKEYSTCFLYYARNIAPMLGRAKNKSMRVQSFFDRHMLMAKTITERKALVEWYGRGRDAEGEEEEEEERVPLKKVRMAPAPSPISIASVMEMAMTPPTPPVPPVPPVPPKALDDSSKGWTEIEDAIIRGWRLEPVFLCSVIPHHTLNEIHQRRKQLNDAT